MSIANRQAFHGSFTSTNASALNEANSRVSLYQAGSTTQISALEPNAVVVITDLTVIAGANLRVIVYDGSDTSPDQSRIIAEGTFAVGGERENVKTPYYCLPGTFPKVKTDTNGQVDVTIRGEVIVPATRFISESEAIGVSEAFTVLEVGFVSVFDSTSLTESLTVGTPYKAIQTNSPIVTAESLSINVSAPRISLNETISSVESLSMAQVSGLSVSDAVALTESVAMLVGRALSGARDFVTVFDGQNAIIVSMLRTLSLNDATSLTESVLTSMVNGISKSESVTAAEATTVSVPIALSVNDSTAITESVSHA